MGLPVGGRGKRWVVLGVSALAAATLFWQASTLWVASHLGRSSRLADLVRAAELEPANAKYWDRVGRFYQTSFDQPDPAQAIRYYREAVELDPRSDRYWMDLASAYEATGNAAEARLAFERAQSAYPVSADVAWSFGNFFLRQGQFPDAFREFHRAVATDPTLLHLVISRCWRSTEDVKPLLDEVLPANANAYFAALDFFSSIDQPDAGLAVWDRLLTLRIFFPLSRSFPFLEELIREERMESAQRVWRQALKASGWPYQAPQGGSVVWNGGFEFDIANGGFDWRMLPIPGTAESLDPTTHHSGSRSLRVDFGGGSNLYFDRVYQLTPVEPHHSYHFRGYMKTEAITTESGTRFLVFDPQHPGATNVATPALTGTNPWTPLETDVVTGPETRVVEILLQRLPSRLFDNKLSGTVWIDDVSLTPSGARAQP